MDHISKDGNMIIRRVIFSSAAIAMLSGCAFSSPHAAKTIAVPSSAQQNPAGAHQPDSAQHKVDQMDASAGTADALARKTAAYTKEMTPLVNSRTGSQPPVPSGVQWADPSQFRLDLTGHANQPDQVSSTIKPVSDTTTNHEKTDATKTDTPNVAVANATPNTNKPQSAPAPAANNSDALELKFAQRVR